MQDKLCQNAVQRPICYIAPRPLPTETVREIIIRPCHTPFYKAQGKSRQHNMLLIMDKKEKKHNPKSHKRLIDKNVKEETVNYYLRIATTLDEGFEGGDDKGM